MNRWAWVALVVMSAFACVTGILGALILPLVMASEGDRWVVAAGAGAVASTVAVLWADRYLGGKAAEETGRGGAASEPASEDRSVEVKGDVSGVIVTGETARIKKR